MTWRCSFGAYCCLFLIRARGIRFNEKLIKMGEPPLKKMHSDHNVLVHGCLVTPYGDMIRVTVGSCNGLLPKSSKPLPESMLTYYQGSALAFTGEQLPQNVLINLIRTITLFKLPTSPRGPQVKLVPYLHKYNASKIQWWGRTLKV